MFLTFLFLVTILGVEVVGHSASAAGFEGIRRSVAERLESDHLRATHQERERLKTIRVTLPSSGIYEDFRAVMHVHAEDSDHTKGTRKEVLQAAKAVGVNVVLWTDHRGPKPDAWRGIRDGVLFIAGSEDGTGGLRFPEFDTTGNPIMERGLRFLSHIEERHDAGTEGFAGMEICNRHTDAILDRTLYSELLKAADNPDRWKALTNTFGLYPDEFFGAGTDYRKEIFETWDRNVQKKPFTGIGANDAHQNQIFLGTTFDPYEISFRNLSTHILARELSEASIRDSLRQGHVYVSHDWLCDPSGFTFGAVNNLGVFTQGDPVPLAGRTRIMAMTPVACTMRLFHNGAVVSEATGTNLNYQAASAGAYRFEAWLNIDGEARPWIYSNPVYLKIPEPAFMKLPSGEISSGVEARQNIAYTEGKDEDTQKHGLDLYIPSGKTNAPVFFFIHGGAWRSGDRSQYPAVGNRFAREGILTVIPSYRLAPEHPHPAQIEDVAAAFDWVVRHVAAFGGDTSRIFVGGHSAGGHLAALLSLDENALKPFNLSPKRICGTIALSGVYNLTLDQGQGSVFGTDPEIRKGASPLFHVNGDRPPFLVTYCQWDYWSLPTQAKEFHTALAESSVPAQLVFIPNENHISEMVHVPNDNDPTAGAILDFIAIHSNGIRTPAKGAD